MSSLTLVAKSTRRTFTIIIGLLLFSIFLKIATSIFGAVGVYLTANVPIQASNGYGKLTAIGANSLPYNPAGSVRFILNTANGGFPQEPSFADVYKFKPVSLSLLSVDTAQKAATSFGFPNTYKSLSQYILDWKSSDNSRDFVYNTQTNQFRIINKQPFAQINKDIRVAGGNAILTQNGSLSAANAILSGIIDTSVYDPANITLTPLLYANDGSISVQQDISTANAVRVVYRRAYKYLQVNSNKSINNNKLVLLPDNPLDGSISITIDEDAANNQLGLIEMTFSNWPIDSSAYSTYTIKNPQQAWADVQAGNAYLAYLVKTGASPYASYQTLSVSRFQVEDISLAYFDGVRQQDYLQPVYVIHGTAILADGSTAEFYFYDPAVL